MIIDAFLDFIMVLVDAILSKTSLGNIDLNFDAIHHIMSFISMAVYFFPWQEVLPILGILVLLQSYRIVIAIFKTIWDFLPFV